MSKIELGETIKYILGDGRVRTYQDLKKVIDETENYEEAKSNVQRIEEGLESFHLMKQANYRNKWKEGVMGGVIAGGLIIGISFTTTPVTSLGAAFFRVGGSSVAGYAASLIYNEGSKTCSRQHKRAIDIQLLLGFANEKLAKLEVAKLSR